MEQENVVIFHLILDVGTTNIEDLIKELEKLPDVQIWRMEGSEIRIGKLPKMLKAIPIDQLEYHDGWLTIKMHETSLARHIFVVCEARDRHAIIEILKRASASISGLRFRIERETLCPPS